MKKEVEVTTHTRLDNQYSSLHSRETEPVIDDKREASLFNHKI